MRTSPSPPKARTPRAFGCAQLRQKCRQLRGQLAEPPNRPVATAAEIAAAWPGGADNPYLGYDGWIQCHAMFTGYARRLEQQDRHSKVDDDALEGAVRAAGAERPVTLTLSDGSVHQVYPKGAYALEWLEALGHYIAVLAVVALEAATMGDEALDLLLASPILRGDAVRTWLWIVTTPGAELPWSDADGPADPPQWTGIVAPQDLLLFDRACKEINGVRMAIMAHAFPSEGGEPSRLAIGGMLGAYSHEHGIPLRDVMRKLSVGAVAAGAIASAESYRVSKARAEAKTEPRGRGAA